LNQEEAMDILEQLAVVMGEDLRPVDGVEGIYI
jgi:hypothetical protein